ncbi:DUF3152 domain-containing protein [Nocardioides sp. CFH 31398]|uniref:DUF3152 domain-containing protein n=1 Tax=Nocardioides sp. CFH 31398 TaxID=2919579 RepID=UPI001F063E79|nr:DUF3152 domain-containing protein [Nocardioides sp. CFH 31398]MCH1867161.1 DUF3152 domain-containing protein [Nocardioides sp. CFH 31398]
MTALRPVLVVALASLLLLVAPAVPVAADDRVRGGADLRGGEPMASTERPRVQGTLRYGETLRATQGRWTRPPQTVRFQWFRGPDPIRGATGQRHRVEPEDVGRKVSVRVKAWREGAGSAYGRSRWVGPVEHRTGVRRVVTYHVETRGRIVVSRAEFRRQAAQTYADARGWRGRGVRFRQVARGGDFTLVLAEAGEVPRFSSGCSAQWSCRVGRYVIINQLRWRTASPAWNRAGGSRRDYRHMVVNHETGHWLGRGHVGCPGRGQLAPVMMQQSKGLDGCRFNPWPTLGELR